jgi:PAS domain S-box-containing protein
MRNAKSGESKGIRQQLGEINDKNRGEQDRAVKEGMTFMSDQQSEAARQREATDLQSLSSDEAQQLFHELRVHQIELERQNEDLRRTRHDLEISRSRYFALYDLAPVGYLTLNEQGKIKEANLAAATLLGTDQKNLLNHPVSQFIFPDDQELCSQHRKQIVETNQAQDWQMRLLRTDGSTLQAHLRGILAPSGEYWITLSDIAESKETVEALRASEARLNKAEKIAHLGSWELDISTNRLIWSDEVYRIFGFKPQEIPSTYEIFLAGVHPEDRAAVHASFTNSVQAGKDSYEFEHRVIRKPTGEIRYVQEKCENIRDASGQVIRSIGMVQDITECKRVEEQLKSREESLKRQNSLFSSLLKNLPLGVFMVEAPTGKPLVANDAALKLLGRGILPNTSCHNLSEIYKAFKKSSHEPYPPEEMPILLGMNGETSHVDDMVIERPDGSAILLDIIGSPVRDDQGKIWASLVSFADITDRKRTEEELRQAKVAADAANIAKSQFLANMSHEIRTPMNGVIGLIELLLTTELNKEQREYAELVKLSGKNLVELISNILDLSKIEAHKIELEESGFDLRKEMAGTMALFSLRAKEKGLKLGTQIEADVPILMKGDVVRLRQILTNLISNSIKFTESGSVLLHISKEREDELQTTLRFLVHDSGIGIAAEKLEEIFKPFSQADGSTTRQYGGTGLGLTIARQLAQLMGGTVGVESVEGEGTSFWFTAVFAKQEERRTSPRSATRVKELSNSFFPAAATTTNSRILVVEDDFTNQLMTKTILEKIGYQVNVANNGAEALNFLEKTDYALVLMDCMMPELNGFETTAVIRDPTSAVRNHAIPIIALTAKAFKEDRASCLAAGMDDYLAKPIEITKVLAVLEKWVPSQLMPDGEGQ